jgi:hypothetical protein
MSVSGCTSESPLNTSPFNVSHTNSSSEYTAEILRLKRKLAATHQELDETRCGRSKKIL